MSLVELSRSTEDPWPRGWWRQPKTVQHACCATHKGHKIPPGHPIYLTGQPGDVFCEDHAPVPRPKEAVSA